MREKPAGALSENPPEVGRKRTQFRFRSFSRAQRTALVKKVPGTFFTPAIRLKTTEFGI